MITPAQYRNLLEYARRRCVRSGAREGRDYEPSWLSANELVHTAVERLLTGGRKWDSSKVDLMGFLRGVIRSLASCAVKERARRKEMHMEDFDRTEGLFLDPEDQVSIHERQCETLLAITLACADDLDLILLANAVIDGTLRREDVSNELGWEPARVSAARIKLQRRLERQGIIGPWYS